MRAHPAGRAGRHAAAHHDHALFGNRRRSHRAAACGSLAPEVSSLPAVTPSLPEQTAPERSSEETHRIVTVLFADVSVRQEASQTPSPEGIAPALRDFAREAGDIIARHGGELHSLVGGCLIAIFGVAGAHESDPERALRAAVEARSAAGRLGLDLSAGLSTGDVLFAKVEAGGWSRAALFGAPADAAWRLSGNAAPGEIVAGEATYRLAARAFEFGAWIETWEPERRIASSILCSTAGEIWGERVTRPT